MYICTHPHTHVREILQVLLLKSVARTPLSPITLILSTVTWREVTWATGQQKKTWTETRN